jgi:uncharacterized membrane protein YkoI
VAIDAPEIFSMKSKRVACAAVAAVLTFGLAFTAHADDPAQLERAISQANVKLPDAIATAERHAGRGHVVKAEFKVKGEGAGFYDIRVLGADNAVTDYRVDGETGKITRANLISTHGPVNGIDPEALQNVQTPLSSAITAAEESSGGKAISVDTDHGGGQVRYSIKVAKADGSITKVTVNGSNGKVAAVE